MMEKPINLYLFSETSRATVYGIGTYLREIEYALQECNVNLNIVHLQSNKICFEIENINCTNHWHIPAPQIAFRSQNSGDLYYRNVVYLIRLNINDTNNLVFQLNYWQEKILADELKQIFSCTTVLAIHYLQWEFALMGNMRRFETIMAQGETSKDPMQENIRNEIENEREICNSVDKIICLAQHTQTILDDFLQIDKDKICLIYNGLHHTERGLIDKRPFRDQMRLPNDVPLILFVGRLDDVKGLNSLVKAFSLVLNELPDSRLIIAGNGNFDKCLKDCDNIWSHVHFTGLLEKENLYKLYNVADIGVMPSFHEQCSYVAIEMMMHGLPLIASTTTGLKEMVEDGVSGLHILTNETVELVDIDSKDLADKIIYLLTHHDDTKAMGQNSRKRYERLYSSQVFKKNLLDFYNSLVSNSNSNANS